MMPAAGDIPSRLDSGGVPSPANEIITAARTMLARGLVAGTTGNVSTRLGGGRMLITPTRVHPDDLTADRLVELGLDGTRADGGGHPSIEWRLHAEVYRARPDVSAIVHSHSPHAIARSFDPSPVLVETEERTYLGLSQINVAEPARAGSLELARAAVAALGSLPAVLLGRHGAVAVGATPRDAVELATVVEHQAQVALLLAAAGISDPVLS